jgi:hypothetical protein
MGVRCVIILYDIYELQILYKEKGKMKISIQKNKTTIIDLLEMTERKNIDKLIDYLQYHSDYFTAPASAKFHLAVKGGLAHHSLSVTLTLEHLVQQFWKGKPIKPDTQVIVGLLHDACKIGIYHWGKREKATEYSFIRDDSQPFGHGEKSIFLIQKYIKLTPQEIAMIRWHMGPYDAEYNRNEKDIHKYYPETKLLYFADDISTQYLEGDF